MGRLLKASLLFALFAPFFLLTFSSKVFSSELDPLGLAPKKLLLSIGISQFKDDIWTDLRFAHKDAEDIYNTFMTEGFFDGGELLTARPDKEGGLDRRAIEKAIERLKQSNLNEDDTVVVYISSHGTLLQKPNGVARYIVTSHSDSQNLHETSLSYDWLLEQFHSLQSRKKVLILAFCYSGNGKSGLTPRMRREIEKMKGFYREPIVQVSEGSIILSASGWREPALEAPKLKNDVYTHFLMKGFENDSNGDGAVSITEAHQFAAEATYAYSGGRQRPSATTQLLGTDPIIVAGKVKKEAPPMLYAYLGQYAKYHVSIDGKDMGPMTKGLSMPEGRVLLTIKDPQTGETLIERAVHFEPGLEYPLERFLNPVFPHTVRVGATRLHIPHAALRRSYGPKDLGGVKVQYSLDDAYKVYDLGVSLQYFPKQTEQIQVDALSFKQTRQMALLNAYVGSREKLAFLTSANRDIVTEARFFMGPLLAYYDRSLEEAAFLQQDKTIVTGGILAGAGLVAKVPYNLIKFGLDVELGALKSPFEERRGVLLSSQVSFYVGTFW